MDEILTWLDRSNISPLTMVATIALSVSQFLGGVPLSA
jgi:hypothetical protein